MLTTSTIRVTGADAFDFLQSQLTNDLTRLEPEPAILAAWCNPKGRVIWLGTVRRMKEGYCMSAPAVNAEQIAAKLTMFRFRSKVEFEVVPDDQAANALFLIERGIPYIGPEQAEQFTPHMLNLDLLDVISFDKGCYPGQEVVARTHYKGATKRRTLRFEADAPVAVGDKIQLDGRDVGEVLNVVDNQLLAVVPVDKADEALLCGAATLSKLAIPYLD